MKPSQDSPDFPNAFYRVSVKGLYVKDDKVLLVHDYTGRNDVDKRPEWELPGGGLDFGEDIKVGLKREVQEEMGLEVVSIAKKPSYIWTTKRTNSRRLEWYWVCTIMFIIDLKDLNFTPTDECREVRFFSKEELQSNLEELAPQIKPLVEHFDPADFS